MRGQSHNRKSIPPIHGKTPSASKIFPQALPTEGGRCCQHSQGRPHLETSQNCSQEVGGGARMRACLESLSEEARRERLERRVSCCTAARRCSSDSRIRSATACSTDTAMRSPSVVRIRNALIIILIILLLISEEKFGATVSACQHLCDWCARGALCQLASIRLPQAQKLSAGMLAMQGHQLGSRQRVGKQSTRGDQEYIWQGAREGLVPQDR